MGLLDIFVSQFIDRRTENKIFLIQLSSSGVSFSIEYVIGFIKHVVTEHFSLNPEINQTS